MELPFNVSDVSVRVVIMCRKNDFDGLPDYTVVIRDTCEYNVDDEIRMMENWGWSVYVDSDNGEFNDRSKQKEREKGVA